MVPICTARIFTAMAQPHASSGQVVHLPSLNDPSTDARSTAILKADQLEVVRIVLPAGKAFPDHHVQGEITVLCLEGNILFRTPQGEQRMGPGDFIHLQRGEPHALEALEDSLALLTICLVV